MMKRLLNLFNGGETPVLDKDELDSIHQKQSSILRSF